MNTKITIVELVDLMAQATSTSKRVCELFLRELFAVTSQALIDGESVKIKGVGTFKVTQVKARKSVDVSTGEANEIAGHSKVTFTPDKSLADAVNQPFAQFETVVLEDEVTDEKLAEIDKQYPSLFDDMDSMPEPPDDLPEPPTPTIDDLPAMPGEPVVSKGAAEPKPVEKQPEVVKPVTPAMATPIDAPVADKKPAEAVPLTAQPVETTPLMGIPIDGPSEQPEQPAQPELPAEEPEDEDDFRRPEPRNAYTPTPEQIENYNKPDRKRWLWIALAALVVGALLWLFLSPGGKKEEPVQEAVVLADSDSVAVDAKAPGAVETSKAPEAPEAEVITDIVTSKIVLSTLSEKHYGSPWFWVYIYEENKSIISDPNNVKPGTEVVIPPAEKYGINAKDPASLKKAQRRSWEILKGK